MKHSILAAMAVAGLIGAPVQAADIVISGFLNDAGNGALVGSDLGPALFADDFDISNNVALYDLVLPAAASVRFDSNGRDAGGVDPYFTLFAGSGPGATFLQSNYDQAFSTGGDFDETYALGAGSYTIAMGAFANMSFAENLGVGTLADGFIGLGQPDFLGNYYYELGVTYGEVVDVAEPSALLMAALGLLALGASRRRPALQQVASAGTRASRAPAPASAAAGRPGNRGARASRTDRSAPPGRRSLRPPACPPCR